MSYVTPAKLGEFKTIQDAANKLLFLEKIVYPTLPTTDLYEGKLAYSKADKKYYGYIDGKWQVFHTEGVLNWGKDENGNVFPDTEAGRFSWNKDSQGNVYPSM